MVVLSAAGWSASEIAALLHYYPKTVRAWIARHHAEGVTGLPDRPDRDDPAKAADVSANASTLCCRHLNPGPPPGSGKPSADPSWACPRCAAASVNKPAGPGAV